jgi:hypothetical protein
MSILFFVWSPFYLEEGYQTEWVRHIVTFGMKDGSRGVKYKSGVFADGGIFIALQDAEEKSRRLFSNVFNN